MHAYAFEGRDQIFRVWIVLIAVLSLLLSYVLFLILQQLELIKQWADKFPWLGGPPSAFAIFAALYKWFDSALWKLSFLCPVPFATIPNLNGTWEVEIIPSKGTESLPGHFTIHQTWSKISITLATDISHSRSLTAAITLSDPQTVILTNEYSVDRKAKAPKNFDPHLGTNRILIGVEKGTPTKLSGHYYTESNRGSYGDIAFNKRVK